MGNSAEEFYLFSADELLSALDGRIDLDTNRVVGFYGTGGFDLPIGGGAEGIYFRGVDTQTGELVEAYYIGGTVGVNVFPGEIGAGVFGFTGAPGSLSGWSVGASGSAINSTSVSVSEDGSILYMTGASTNLAVSAGGGYTYRVAVDNEFIYNFGEVVYYDYTFTGGQYQAAMFSLVNSPRGQIEIEYIHPDGYIITQTMWRTDNGPGSYTVSVRERITDLDGNAVPREIALDYIAARVWRFDLDAQQISNINSYEECFLAGTQISMWPGADGMPWTKPIEDITPDDIVLSYDARGNLVPGRVTRTFRNQATHILDFWGTGVTPGHVVLCGDGRFKGQHVPLIDILRADAAVVREDGGEIRACTGAPVGSLADREVTVVTGTTTGDVVTVSQRTTLRLGTRVRLRDGRDTSLLETLEADLGPIAEDGTLADGRQIDALTLRWPFGDMLPAPEDYILSRSDLTLAEIYAAAEWEFERPQMAAPTGVSDASFGIANVPPAFSDRPDMPQLDAQDRAERAALRSALRLASLN